MDTSGRLYADRQRTKTLKNEFSNTTDEAMTPTPKTREETLSLIKNYISSPAYARGLLASLLEGVPLRVSSWIGLAAVSLLPVNIALDYASGRSVGSTIKANTVGFTAGYVAS